MKAIEIIETLERLANWQCGHGREEICDCFCEMRSIAEQAMNQARTLAVPAGLNAADIFIDISRPEGLFIPRRILADAESAALHGVLDRAIGLAMMERQNEKA